MISEMRRSRLAMNAVSVSEKNIHSCCGKRRHILAGLQVDYGRGLEARPGELDEFLASSGAIDIAQNASTGCCVRARTRITRSGS